MGAENGKKRVEAQEVIDAFDRERAEAHAHRRRHYEWLRTSSEKDRPAFNEHLRKEP